MWHMRGAEKHGGRVFSASGFNPKLVVAQVKPAVVFKHRPCAGTGLTGPVCD